MMRQLIYMVLMMGIMASCGQQQPPLFKRLSATRTGIDFKNQLNYTDSLTVLEFEYMFNGGGVSVGDFNKDGLQDLFFTGNMVSSRLYLNKGGLHFEDITQKAGVQTTGWCYGSAIVDINQDGFQDIYICKAGSRLSKPEDMKNLFFINNGDNTFTEHAAEMGLDENGYDIQVAFLDYDKDGDLDMYLLKNAFVNYNRNNVRLKQTEGQAASTDKLFRNEGNLKFKDVSAEAGIQIEGFGLGVNVCDLNEDDYPDIYVSNDFLTNDLVWINNKNGTFTNKAPSMLRHTTYNGMGNDVSDYNNDGHLDIAVVDMLPPDNKRWKLTMMGNQYDEFEKSQQLGYEPQYVRNTLQLNNGDGTFSEIGQLAGVHATEWSWAPLFADFDNDGWKDLFIANGYRQDVTNLDFIMYGKRALFMGSAAANRRERLDELKKYQGIRLHNFLFKNKRDLTFADKSKDWGMTDEKYANGAIYADLDNDGDLDLITNNLDEASIVYENQLNTIEPKHQWLRLRFNGMQGNRDGLNTKIWLWQGDSLQFQYFSPYRGYLSSVEPLVHFGLGAKPIDSMRIRWADGKEQFLKNVPTNQILTLDYKNALLPIAKKPFLQPQTLFSDVTAQVQVNFKHTEDAFTDFKLQPLLQQQYARLGPGLAAGDVNGDGLDDFFVGNGLGNQGVLHLQQRNGTFKTQLLPDVNVADDMGALLFDADNDNDLDLYVASGGVNPQKQGDESYQHRLYWNDGKGNFLRKQNAIPIKSSGSSVIASDFDHDGDLDLFVGGRVKAGEYPLSPSSHLLQNDGKGNFKDITPKTLSAIGMVTSAIWTDMDNDNWQDLILVGEFMPITYFKNQQGTLQDAPISIPNSSGWWNSIAGGDFDQDGDIDYMLGNLGRNAQLKASEKEPICVYGKDFDKNGRLDPILCHYVDGTEYVFHARDDMSKQIAAMRARFRTYSEYAAVPFQDMMRADELKDALILKCTHLESSYLENLGNGQFKLHVLPLEAQFSPLFGMLVEDFTGDGFLDVLCVGNSFSTEVNTGRYDAQGGLLLKGDGKGQFTADRKSFNILGDHKSISQLEVGNQRVIIVGANSDKLKVLKINELRPKKMQPIQALDEYALMTHPNGKTSKQEFYYGNSYLSQQVRKLAMDTACQKIQIFNHQQKSRIIHDKQK